MGSKIHAVHPILPRQLKDFLVLDRNADENDVLSTCVTASGPLFVGLIHLPFSHVALSGVLTSSEAPNTRVVTMLLSCET
jgi:hypothetical protein